MLAQDLENEYYIGVMDFEKKKLYDIAKCLLIQFNFLNGILFI